MGLAFFDIANIIIQSGFGNYDRIGWCDTPGYAEDIIIIQENDKSYALLACGVAGLQIIDFSDTSNIHIIGAYDASGYAKEIAYKGERIYLTTETSGLQVFSIADITNPKLIGIIETEYALGVAVDENYVYIADEKEGLIIIDIP